MTGQTLTRAEQRAFVLALLDVEPRDWWWDVVHALPSPIRTLIAGSSDYYDSVPYDRECLLAAADLLRPRWTREEAESAALNLPMLLALGSPAEQMRAYERVIRMITGEEP